MEEILKEMQKIGFTSYEAKIYLALLHRNPATGYEISKISGVPQAKVYENILRLGNRGAVLNVGNDPVKYVPLPPEKLLKKADAEFEKSINVLKSKLPALGTGQEPDYVWNIRGYFSTMEKASQMIKEAENEINLAIWGEDVMYLYNELAEAVSRGVQTSILIYGSKSIMGLENVHYYAGERKLMKEAGGRCITLVADGREVLTGQLEEEKEGISIWTSNPAILYASSRYIELEILMSGKTCAAR
ncbi:MAG: TrmB family transcriptional regulator [Firmicutes bacterium]|nr:TrmB family transcriptional regulator [Bacillota bacterium]